MDDRFCASAFFFKIQRLTFRAFPFLLLVVLNAVFVLSLDDFRSSYFFSKHLHVKEGEPMKTTEVFDEEICKLLCVREPSCYSVNFKHHPEPKSKLHRCELFKPSSAGKILPSQQFDYYKKIEGK